MSALLVCWLYLQTKDEGQGQAGCHIRKRPDCRCDTVHLVAPKGFIDKKKDPVQPAQFNVFNLILLANFTRTQLPQPPRRTPPSPPSRSRAPAAGCPRTWCASCRWGHAVPCRTVPCQARLCCAVLYCDAARVPKDAVRMQVGAGIRVAS